MISLMADDPKLETLAGLLEKRQIYASVEVAAAEGIIDRAWGTRVQAPKTVALECLDGRCCSTMVWDLSSDVEVGAVANIVKFYSLFYRCRHCLSSWVRYEIFTNHISNSAMRVVVHGICPRQYPGVSSTVLEALSDNEAVMYMNAIQSREQEMGLGALAYLRRVVEEAINVLLDLLASVLADSEESKQQEYVAQVEWLKSQKAFDKKAVAAAAVLPKSFFAGGHNPFARLHEWASAGVHNETDQDCCELFDEIRGVFDALFERLHAERETRRLYADRLGKISKRVPTKAIQKPE